LLAGRSSSTAGSGKKETALIDANVWLGQWLARRLALDDPAALAAKLGKNGVERALASSLEGVFAKDIGGVNARLTEQCSRHEIFEPIGVVNLKLPRWEDDVEACVTKHRMRAIRLLPGYHGYKLDDDRFAALLKLAAARHLAVQIAVSLEDERTQNPLLRVPPVDVTPLPTILEAVPDARVMLLNWPQLSGGKPLLLTLQNTHVFLDIAMLEGIAGIETVLQQIPVERLCFGSHAPVFYFESAKLKLHESEITDAQLDAISRSNALHFLGV